MEKRNTGRIVVSVLLVVAIFSMYGLRLADWQLINGANYRETADSTNTYSVKIEPARGEILDTNGVELAMNITGYKVVFDKLYVEKEKQNEDILKLINIFNLRGEKWLDKLPITVDADGNYQFVAEKEKDIATLKSNDYARLADYATAQQCIDKLADSAHYDCAQYTPQQKRDIISVRYNMQKNLYSYDTKYTFADAISTNMVAIVSEQNIAGVKVNTSPVRKYVHGEVAPNVVGAIGAITTDQYKANKDKGYKLNSQFGQFGIEKAMEDYLAGKEGEQKVEATSGGGTVNVVQTVNAQPGNTVYSTIDARLQNAISAALKKNVDGAQKEADPGDVVTGAAVVLNAKDFSVLAAQSYPSYDLTKYMEDENYYSQLNSDEKYKPLNDRALNGIYAIGSTMKPCIAAAALQEGTITKDTIIHCGGQLTLFDDYRPYCFGHKAHGNITVQTALEVSCNIFFLEVGDRLKIDAMNLYQQRFGLGVNTGIEIDASEGVLAGPAERISKGKPPWPGGGETAAAAIGQSDNLLSPQQLATYVATIANNGVRLNTHIVKKITDYSRENVVMETPVKEMDNAGVSAENLKIVQDGMRLVATHGTASAYFENYDIPIAAKTGTAENSGGDHEVFIGYGPFEDPQIAIAVVIEHGKTSKWSNSTAKDIFNAYFHGIGMTDLPTVNSDGTLNPVVTPPAANTSSTTSGTSPVTSTTPPSSQPPVSSAVTPSSSASVSSKPSAVG